MRISDWSSDVCSSDLSVLATLQRHVFRLHILRVADVEAAEEQVLDLRRVLLGDARLGLQPLERLPHRVVLGIHREQLHADVGGEADHCQHDYDTHQGHAALRSEEHTSELQSLMRISYAVTCLTKKK